MHQKDLLWKAVIEEFFYDLLAFFYADFLPKVDLTKGFTFLEQELQQLYEASEEVNRRADKLVKVYLKDGSEHWLLVHIEVQGYQDANFARRMFTSYYRLLDRYNKPIEALVIYTDKWKKHHYSHYENSAIKTKVRYDFHSFEITQYTPKEYEAMQNPFAVIFQTALLALEQEWNDETLLQQKAALYRNLLRKGYQKVQIKELATFIKTYVNFSKPEYNRKFDEVTTTISQNPTNMGIIETVIYINKEARLIGEKKALLIKRFQIIYKLLQNEVPVITIAEVEDVQPVFVEVFKNHIKEKELKILTQQIEEVYAKMEVNTLEQTMQQRLVHLLLPYPFSDKALASFFGLKPEFVEKTRVEWENKKGSKK